MPLPIHIAVNTGSKRGIQTNIPSSYETVSYIFTGFTVSDPTALRMGIYLDGQLVASCNVFTGGSGTYTGVTNLNTLELIGAFGYRRNRTELGFRILLQDIVAVSTLLDDITKIMDNPYLPGGATPVDPIGGVDYAPLDGYLAHIGNTDIHTTAIEHAKLTGIEAGAEVNDTAAEIRDKLQTLTTTSRLSADSVKDGAANLFFTSAERTKLLGIEAGAQVNVNTTAQQYLTDNTTTYITLGAVATYRAFFIDYVIDNTSDFVAGSIVVFHNGTMAIVTQLGKGVYTADLDAVTLDADINGGNVRLKVVLAMLASDARMVYTVRTKTPVYA